MHAFRPSRQAGLFCGSCRVAKRNWVPPETRIIAVLGTNLARLERLEISEWIRCSQV